MPEIEVCIGPECGNCGGVELLQRLRDDGIEAAAGHCRGLCHEAPVVDVGGKLLAETNSEKLQEMLG